MRIILMAVLALPATAFAFGDMSQPGIGDGVSVTVSSLTITGLESGSVLFSTTPTTGAIGEDNANFFWDDTNNRLGIGTASPATLLHMSSGTLTIDGNTAASISAIGTVVASNGSEAAPSYGFSDSPDTGIFRAAASQLGFVVAGAEKMRLVHTTGNLGIGTTIPAATLDVNGNAQFGSGATKSTFTATGQLIMQRTATQTIAAGNIITANACGGIKRIDAGGAVTTDTTNTFTAPAEANAGCCMDVINIDTVDTITLDANPNFNAAADVAMTPCDVIRVCSDGTDWFPIDALVANTCN